MITTKTELIEAISEKYIDPEGRDYKAIWAAECAVANDLVLAGKVPTHLFGMPDSECPELGRHWWWRSVGDRPHEKVVQFDGTRLNLVLTDQYTIKARAGVSPNWDDDTMSAYWYLLEEDILLSASSREVYDLILKDWFPGGQSTDLREPVWTPVLPDCLQSDSWEGVYTEEEITSLRQGLEILWV